MDMIQQHFDSVAGGYDNGKKKYDFYYTSLKRLLIKLIGKNKDVLEIGCGTGDLLFALKPRSGYGQDISSVMIYLAKKKYKTHKNLKFSIFWPKGYYEYIFMSDVIEHLTDPLAEFKKIQSKMKPSSKLVITMANPLWEPLLMVWEKLGLKMREGPHKRIGCNDILILGRKSGLKIVKHDYELLIPVRIFFITSFVNKYIEPLFKKLSFIEYFVFEKA